MLEGREQREFAVKEESSFSIFLQFRARAMHGQGARFRSAKGVFILYVLCTVCNLCTVILANACPLTSCR